MRTIPNAKIVSHPIQLVPVEDQAGFPQHVFLDGKKYVQFMGQPNESRPYTVWPQLEQHQILCLQVILAQDIPVKDIYVKKHMMRIVSAIPIIKLGELAERLYTTKERLAKLLGISETTPCCVANAHALARVKNPSAELIYQAVTIGPSNFVPLALAAQRAERKRRSK